MLNKDAQKVIDVDCYNICNRGMDPEARQNYEVKFGPDKGFWEWRHDNNFKASEILKGLGLQPGQKVTVNYHGGRVGNVINYTGVIKEMVYPQKPCSSIAAICLQQKKAERWIDVCWISKVIVWE